MSVNQEFSINTKPAAAGDMYGLATTNSQRLTYSTEAPQTAYGLAVQQGAKANTIKLGSETDSGAILGITMRENKLEAAKRPSDGTIGIPKGQPLAVMIAGPINVLFKTAVTGKEVGVNAKGEFGAVDGDFKACPNVTVLEYPVTEGSVAAVMVNIFPGK